MKPKSSFAALCILVASLGFAACGDDDDETDTAAAPAPATTDAGGGGGGAGGGGLTVTADEGGDLAWEPTELTTQAGQVTITLDNPAAVSHNIEIEGNGVDEVSDTVSQSTTTVTANLQPGEYRYYCNIPGHAEAGMDGTLTVK
jgi:plastocyanin